MDNIRKRMSMIVATLASIVMAFVMAFAVTPASGINVQAAEGEVTAAITALSGEGTEASPYTIGSVEEFKFFRDDVTFNGNRYKGLFAFYYLSVFSLNYFIRLTKI